MQGDQNSHHSSTEALSCQCFKIIIDNEMVSNIDGNPIKDIYDMSSQIKFNGFVIKWIRPIIHNCAFEILLFLD